MSESPRRSASDATSGVSNVALRALLERHWEASLRQDPLFATRLGDHRFDRQVPDYSVAAFSERKKSTRAWLEEARAIAASGTLDAADVMTSRLFIESLVTEIAGEICSFQEWSVAPLSNPLARWNELSDLHVVTTPQSGDDLIERFRQVPKTIDDELTHLQNGITSKAFQNRESLTRVVSMIRAALSDPPDALPMLLPTRQPRPEWTPAQKLAFDETLTHVVTGEVLPALRRYLDFIETKLLPSARSDQQVGLGSLPFGRECYSALVEGYTTIETTPAELHQRGVDEIARINEEMRVLGEKLFGTKSFAKTLEHLRTSPALYFASSEEVADKAEKALALARSKIPQYFGVLPRADCIVRNIPDYEAPYTTIAYYRQPVPDGSRPGEYFINVSAPTTRPRFEAEALAYHESIPGHHLQIAIAQELPEVPAFRKHLGMTVFVEGWALYAEHLANEMGLYTADLDRMGMLSYEAWRASRLVVDTGIHAKGWSREQAKQYMLEHTALAANNIDNEVDRYIVWPGQALAYKTGQMEILRLRRLAERELGADFDVRRFHDVLLQNGAVSLPILTAEVEGWIRSARAHSNRR